MPNWCHNKLSITGDADELKKFREFAKGNDGKENELFISDKSTNNEEITDFDFEQFISSTEDKKKYIEEWNAYPELRKKWGNFNMYWFNQTGYEWCVDNHGTKWSARDVTVEQTEQELIYTFDTAWSPPTPVIITASKLFPKLTFNLTTEEESLSYGGTETYQNGNLIDEIIREQTHTICPHCGENITHWADEDLTNVQCWECEKKIGKK